MLIASTAGSFDLELGWAVAAAFAVLFALSFFFSGTETAFFSLQDLDRRRIADGETATDRRIHALLSDRASLITTVLMGNETVNVAISATAAGIVAVLAPDKPWLTIVAVTPLLVLLSEITPKVIAFRYARRWATVVAWPITLLYFVSTPVRFVVTGIVRLLGRLAGVSPEEATAGVGEAEFLVLVEQGAASGIVDESEREIIEAVFELDDLPLKRVMTPAHDIFALPVDVSWHDLLAACQDARFSRVPIYEGSPDEIIGVLLVKDLLKHRRAPLQTTEQLRGLLLEPVFVPGTKPADEMMREMIRRRIHMAFVVDEHGSLRGLVALDDLIIELVGELGDTDDEPEPAHIEPLSDGLAVRASMDIDDFIEETGIAVPDGDFHTVGGFVIHALGRLPEEGENFDACDRHWEIAEMEGRRVALVRVRAMRALHEAHA